MVNTNHPYRLKPSTDGYPLLLYGYLLGPNQDLSRQELRFSRFALINVVSLLNLACRKRTLTCGSLFEVLSRLRQIGQNTCVELNYSCLQPPISFRCALDIQSFRHCVATDQLGYPSNAFYHQRKSVRIVDGSLRVLLVKCFTQTALLDVLVEGIGSPPKGVLHVPDRTAPQHPQSA